MKTYTITVNGTAYEVTVEETTGRGAAAVPAVPRPAAQTAPVPAAPAAAPAAAAPAPAAAAAPAPAAPDGATRIEAGAAGKVFKIEVKVGQEVKKGDSIVILEAMKMEIPMVSPVDGKVATINCAVGDPVEAGNLLATIN